MTVTPEDIAAMREQGDLHEYLLILAGRPPKPPKTPPPVDGEPAVARAPFASPHHRPGAWPSGTRPAGPNTCHPDCDCAITPPHDRP